MTHDLKILPEWFNAVISGVKTFEIRKDNRNFQPRDELLLREWDGNAYTGRTCMADVTMVLRGEYCREGYCTMAIRVRGLSTPAREVQMRYNRLCHYCPDCKTAVDHWDKYCRRCGAKFGGGADNDT